MSETELATFVKRLEEKQREAVWAYQAVPFWRPFKRRHLRAVAEAWSTAASMGCAAVWKAAVENLGGLPR